MLHSSCIMLLLWIRIAFCALGLGVGTDYRNYVYTRLTAHAHAGQQWVFPEVTTVYCGKACAGTQNCLGFSMRWESRGASIPRKGFCSLDTAGEGQTVFSLDPNTDYFMPSEQLPRSLITACNSSTPDSDIYRCELAYDGIIEAPFMVAETGVGYTGSTGWIRVDLLTEYVIRTVRVLNRCNIVGDQAHDLEITLGDLANYQVEFECLTNCSLNEYQTFVVPATPASSVRLDLLTKCTTNPGKVGVQEMQLFI